MKKFIAMVTSFILIISLVACKPISTGSEMKITATQLTKEESDILNLMAYNTSYKVYDYVLNDKAKSIQMNFYTLDRDGKWVENGGFSSEIESLSGKIAISTLGENENLRVSFSDEAGATTWTSDSEVYKNLDVMSRTITWAEESEIVYNTEIPLAIQILTNSNEISTYGVHNFKDSEKFKGYDIVNAITITFHEKVDY